MEVGLVGAGEELVIGRVRCASGEPIFLLRRGAVGELIIRGAGALRHNFGVRVVKESVYAKRGARGGWSTPDVIRRFQTLWFQLRVRVPQRGPVSSSGSTTV